MEPMTYLDANPSMGEKNGSYNEQGRPQGLLCHIFARCGLAAMSAVRHKLVTIGED